MKLGLDQTVYPISILCPGFSYVENNGIIFLVPKIAAFYSRIDIFEKNEDYDKAGIIKSKRKIRENNQNNFCK